MSEPRIEESNWSHLQFERVGDVLRVAERTDAAFDPSLIHRIEPDAWRP